VGLVAVLASVVGLQTLRDRQLMSSRVNWSDYGVRAAMACGLLSIVYVLCLSSETIGFRPASFVYVLLVGVILTRFDKAKAEPLVVLALLLSGGTYLLFTKVFSLVLP
jgi:hypothetical protein